MEEYARKQPSSSPASQSYAVSGEISDLLSEIETLADILVGYGHKPEQTPKLESVRVPSGLFGEIDDANKNALSKIKDARSALSAIRNAIGK